MKNSNPFKNPRTLVMFSVLLVSLISLQAAGQAGQQKKPVNQNTQEATVAGPVLTAPAEKAVLTFFPRELKLEWNAVPGAKEYEVEVEINNGKWGMLKNLKVAGLTTTMIFPGDNPGRWRVRAILANGTFSRWSAREFSFSTPPAGNAGQKNQGAKPEGNKPVIDQSLKVPEILGPADGSVFNQTPRQTKLDWGAVEGASSYEVQVEYKAGTEWKVLKQVKQESTSLTINFVGAQPGRWRVCSLAEGKRGPFSKWVNFTYTK